VVVRVDKRKVLVCVMFQRLTIKK